MKVKQQYYRIGRKRERKAAKMSLKTGRAGKLVRKERWAARPEQPLPEDDR